MSLAGALVKNLPSQLSEGEKETLIKCKLPEYGEIECSGRVVRKGGDWVVTGFHDLEEKVKIKIWDYISRRLGSYKSCPYCGKEYTLLPPVCNGCGWRLTFSEPDYLEYYERMALLRRIHSITEGLDTEALHRCMDFIDTEILKIGAEEIQEFVGTCDKMLQVFSNIRKVAPTDIPVLILGESGTGKELTALAIHERSKRAGKPFIPINCAAIPENLMESELFGHERGAFTGAYASKMGKFEQANGGTLFLDEIGELPLSLQAKLLRFLEDQTIERIGSTKGRKVDVRIIAATNRDLKAAVEGGRFRNDLYYRLEAFVIELPPVRERGDDSIILAKHFLNKFSKEAGLSKTFTDEAIRAIRAYPWPGNVREIINKVRRAIVISEGEKIGVEDLGLTMEGVRGVRGKRTEIERWYLKEVLERCGYNISKAARLLGISRPTLYSLKRRYGL